MPHIPSLCQTRLLFLSVGWFRKWIEHPSYFGKGTSHCRQHRCSHRTAQYSNRSLHTASSIFFLSHRCPSLLPLTQRNCLTEYNGVTKSLCAAMTASMSLYAPGVSSSVPSVLSHSTPSVAAAWSATVKFFLASVRLIFRPAPCEHEQNESSDPSPATM